MVNAMGLPLREVIPLESWNCIKTKQFIIAIYKNGKIQWNLKNIHENKIFITSNFWKNKFYFHDAYHIFYYIYIYEIH